jgi:hypothetical protein
MLIRSEYSINSFPTGKRLIWLLTNPFRKLMLKLKIDPAMLKFWNKKGKQIRIWRKRHGLKEEVEQTKTSAPVRSSMSINKQVLQN